jgi:hypothetical protein
MKSRFLAAFISRATPDFGADRRGQPREEESGRFAGLGLKGRYHIVTLHNLSPGGACVQMPVEATPGERVKITSGTLNRNGRVSWIEGTRAGIAFD